MLCFYRYIGKTEEGALLLLCPCSEVMLLIVADSEEYSFWLTLYTRSLVKTRHKYELSSLNLLNGLARARIKAHTQNASWPWTKYEIHSGPSLNSSLWFFMRTKFVHGKPESQDPIDNLTSGDQPLSSLVGWCTYPPTKVVGFLSVMLLNLYDMSEPCKY